MVWKNVQNTISLDMSVFSKVIDQIGSTAFDEALLTSVNEIAPVEEITGYLIDAKQDKHFGAGWCGKRADTSFRVEQYVNKCFKFDPVLKSMPEDEDVSTSFYRHLYSRTVSESQYRWVFFDEPGFHSEIAVIQKLKTGWNMIKFHMKTESLSAELCKQMGELGSFLIPVARRHTLYVDGSYNREARPMTQEKLIIRLEKRFPELTWRERQVCALTILGSSTKNIAEALSITHSTVMTYRRRAYGRLGINNVNVLIREII